MQALILAAGRGRRMKGLTEELPKSLVKVNGKELLRSAIEQLGGADISSIGIVTGYRSNLLSWPEFQNTFHNGDWETTNMVYSLMCADPWPKRQSTLICYSDILFTEKTVRAIADAPGDIVVANNVNWLDHWSKRFEDPLCDAESFKTDSEGHLTEIGQKAASVQEVQGQFMGLIKVTPKGWAQMAAFTERLPRERFRKIDMTSLLNELIQAGTKIQTVEVDQDWFEFDSEEDLINYNHHQSQKEV